jgi:hypothetical protein
MSGLPLVEASKLSNTVLGQGVVETFVKDDPILQRIRWETLVGNAYEYTREATEAGANWYAVNEIRVTNNPTWNKLSAVPKILDSPVELDDFTKKTRSNVNDIKKELQNAAVKAAKKKFMEGFYYGNKTTNPKEIDGLHVLLNDTTYNTLQVDDSDTQTVPLQMSGHLDKALDMVKGFKSVLILSSKGLKRGVDKYLRSVGAGATATKDEFGVPLDQYRPGLYWATSDYILDTELTSAGAFSASTGGLTTSIFILSFEPRALEGMQVEPMKWVDWAPVPKTNNEWAHIQWYPTILIKSLVSCVKIVGIDADGTVAA